MLHVIKKGMKNILAILIATILFAIVAGIFAFSASISINLLYAILTLLGVAIIYQLAGGRALHRSKEIPEKILGIHIEIKEPDGLAVNPPAIPEAIVTHYDNEKYKLEFTQPLIINNRTENYVYASARHVGYPIYRVKKSGILGVNTILESGEKFIACINRI